MAQTMADFIAEHEAFVGELDTLYLADAQFRAARNEFEALRAQLEELVRGVYLYRTATWEQVAP